MASIDTLAVVYRGGSRTPANLTPRPGVDTAGLSTFERLEQATPPGGKAQVIDLSRLQEPLVGVPDTPPQGHVSIRPGSNLTLEVMQSIEQWAATRGTGDIHPFTRAIVDAITGQVWRPR